MGNGQKTLVAEKQARLLEALQARFAENRERHSGISWADVQQKLEAAPQKLWALNEMEESGGEPDVVGFDAESSEIIFFDCSPESPEGRRSFCYDQAALEARKKNKPENSAWNMAETMGTTLLTEAEYRHLQTLGSFDLKTSSWIATPDEIRKLGGALFCDRRYDHVFVYHNGADSYYAARGFRVCLRV